MDEKMQQMLLGIPGARRAASGVILPMEGGGFYHVHAVHDLASQQDLSDDERFYLAFCARREILRLRELRNGHDYLLRLRANALVDSARGVRVMNARRQAFEQKGRPWSLTEYYHTRDHHHKQYLELLGRAHRKRLRDIPAGLAFVPEMNALCVRSLVGDIVVASENLEHFYRYMTLAFHGRELGMADLDRNHALLIAARIARGSEAPDFDLDPRGVLEPVLEREVARRVHAQMQFTFGHEYAHLLRGHLAGDATAVAGAGDVKTYAHALEYEADLYAVRHVEQHADACRTIAEGACDVLVHLDFIGRVHDLCALKAFSVSSTHPSPEQRLRRLHQALGKRSPLAGDAQIDALLERSAAMAERLRRIVDAAADRGQDLMEVYGSAYLPGYKPKRLQDRIDY